MLPPLPHPLLPSAATGPLIQRQWVWQCNSTHRYGHMSMIEALPGGRLAAAWQAAPGHEGESMAGLGRVQGLWYSVSPDNGYTWPPPSVAVGGGRSRLGPRPAPGRLGGPPVALLQPLEGRGGARGRRGLQDNQRSDQQQPLLEPSDRRLALRGPGRLSKGRSRGLLTPSPPVNFLLQSLPGSHLSHEDKGERALEGGVMPDGGFSLNPKTLV